MIITELIDQNDRQGRVEAELNLTYLRESNTDNLIYREWIIFDWDAGDLSSKWEIYIVHDPPRWSPKSANYASFFETDNGLMTRSGPEIIIQILESYVQFFPQNLMMFLFKNLEIQKQLLLDCRMNRI